MTHEYPLWSITWQSKCHCGEAFGQNIDKQDVFIQWFPSLLYMWIWNITGQQGLLWDLPRSTMEGFKQSSDVKCSSSLGKSDGAGYRYDRSFGWWLPGNKMRETRWNPQNIIAQNIANVLCMRQFWRLVSHWSPCKNVSPTIRDFQSESWKLGTPSSI